MIIQMLKRIPDPSSHSPGKNIFNTTNSQIEGAYFRGPRPRPSPQPVTTPNICQMTRSLCIINENFSFLDIGLLEDSGNIQTNRLTVLYLFKLEERTSILYLLKKQLRDLHNSKKKLNTQRERKSLYLFSKGICLKGK